MLPFKFKELVGNKPLENYLMNVFVLNSGRCGSTTFVKACQYINNFTSGHETRIHEIGASRLDYSDNHIEVDNRLCWFLGRLDDAYSDNACYIYLKRNRTDVVKSFIRRTEFGIMKAYQDGIYLNIDESVSDEQIANDYLDTIDRNVRHFLSDKTHVLEICIENIEEDFVKFWELINASGDLDSALREFSINYNASS